VVSASLCCHKFYPRVLRCATPSQRP
jgi:hypothetical protein